LVSDIPAGDGKMANSFLQCKDASNREGCWQNKVSNKDIGKSRDVSNSRDIDNGRDVINSREEVEWCEVVFFWKTFLLCKRYDIMWKKLWRLFSRINCCNVKYFSGTFIAQSRLLNPAESLMIDLRENFKNFEFSVALLHAREKLAVLAYPQREIWNVLKMGFLPCNFY
jgi:hypothetical protein